jgi:hypothetical protein
MISVIETRRMLPKFSPPQRQRQPRLGSDGDDDTSGRPPSEDQRMSTLQICHGRVSPE